jgi:hypothetical protein
MIDIYHSVENIPQNILFVKAPRLKIDGFHWAPATFLELRNTPFASELEPPAKLTPRGLVVTKDCIFINGEFKVDYNFPTTLYIISCSLDGELSQFALQNFDLENEQATTINNAAIILRVTIYKFNYSSCVLVSLVGMHENNSSSVSPLIMRDQKDTLYSKFERPFEFWRITPSNRLELEKKIASPKQKTYYLKGELVSNVRICVD